MLVVNSRVRIPLREFEITFARSAGPGGQNVNKLNTKATLRWPIVSSPTLPDDVRRRLMARHPRRVTSAGDLLITSQRFRDAGRNVADCLEKLRAMLVAVAEPPKRRKPTRPTRASVRRRREQKQMQSRKKDLRRSPGSE
jgi:ribosome-associated protein